LDKINEQIRKHKKTSEWTDEDEKIRYTKLNIISNKLIQEIIHHYNNGVPVTSISKGYKFSYYRIRKITQMFEEIC
jgi:hypothetical protein